MLLKFYVAMLMIIIIFISMKLSINGNIFKVKIQTSPEETQEGMMFKKFNKTFNGMLFVMKNQEHCFWMKNCIIPLDIIFIDNDVITKIHHIISV